MPLVLVLVLQNDHEDQSPFTEQNGRRLFSYAMIVRFHQYKVTFTLICFNEVVYNVGASIFEWKRLVKVREGPFICLHMFLSLS